MKKESKSENQPRKFILAAASEKSIFAKGKIFIFRVEIENGMFINFSSFYPLDIYSLIKISLNNLGTLVDKK